MIRCLDVRCGALARRETAYPGAWSCPAHGLFFVATTSTRESSMSSPTPQIVHRASDALEKDQRVCILVTSDRQAAELRRALGKSAQLTLTKHEIHGGAFDLVLDDR